MKRSCLAGLFCLATMGSTFLSETAGAATLLRGPYLQIATPHSIIIRWRTDEPAESIVSYGTGSNNLHFVDGDLEPTTEHEVKLSGLLRDTRYFYSIGSLDETLAGGPDCLFFTHPAPGVAKPTRVWAIGDCGTATIVAGNQISVRDAYYNYAGSRYTDVWLALGDNAYYSGTDHEYQAHFFNVYPRLLRQTALWSTIGNHETYSVPFGARIPYEEIFSFPEQGEAGGVPSGTEKYYSFNYAHIHFVCLDSELSDRAIGSPMLAWLQSDLEANTNEWLIVFWHSPPYTKGSHDSDNLFDNGGNMSQMRMNVAPVLEAYGADLVLCGHSHIYERSFLMRGHYGFSDSLQPSMILDGGSGRPGDTGDYRKPVAGPSANEGTVYVVAGSSGWTASRTGYHPAMFMDELQMGSLVLDINGNRLDAVFLRETGAIDDSFTIIKGDPEPFRVCAFVLQNGQTIARWKSVGGQQYRIERASSLESPDWQPMSDPITASGATTAWTNGVPLGATRSFYRVVEMAR